jgi:hypothetical protein
VEAADIVMINQLLAFYGHIVDAKQWERFDELFLDDAVLDYTGVNAPQVYEGVDAIRGYFRDANHPSAHHVINVYVYEEGGQTKVKSKFFVPFTRPTHQPHRWYGGDYDDVVVETDRGWRFQRRVCTARWLYTTDEAAEAHRRTW